MAIFYTKCSLDSRVIRKAYAFGLKIQDAVRERNLVVFFSWVGVELDYGPRRKYIENRTFREIFSDSWRAAVLNDEPSCTPVGWRGFMLGSGQVWYKGNDTFRIVSVSEWIPEEFAPTPVGWKVDGRLLLPSALFMSGCQVTTSMHMQRSTRYQNSTIFNLTRASILEIQYIHLPRFTVGTKKSAYGKMSMIVQVITVRSRSMILRSDVFRKNTSIPMMSIRSWQKSPRFFVKTLPPICRADA